MDCNRPECRAEWEKCGGGSNKEEQENYRSGFYGLQHCENKECHSIYFKLGNGGTCKECKIEVCEGCQSKWNKNRTCLSCSKKLMDEVKYERQHAYYEFLMSKRMPY